LGPLPRPPHEEDLKPFSTLLFLALFGLGLPAQAATAVRPPVQAPQLRAQRSQLPPPPSAGRHGELRLPTGAPVAVLDLPSARPLMTAGSPFALSVPALPGQPLPARSVIRPCGWPQQWPVRPPPPPSLA
jgi:hypothetical protein